jgi:hypothetical protein
MKVNRTQITTIGMSMVFSVIGSISTGCDPDPVETHSNTAIDSGSPTTGTITVGGVTWNLTETVSHSDLTDSSQFLSIRGIQAGPPATEATANYSLSSGFHAMVNYCNGSNENISPATASAYPIVVKIVGPGVTNPCNSSNPVIYTTGDWTGFVGLAPGACGVLMINFNGASAIANVGHITVNNVATQLSADPGSGYGFCVTYSNHTNGHNVVLVQ